MINLANADQRESFWRAVKASWDALEEFRKGRLEMIQSYAGHRYCRNSNMGLDEGRRTKIVNLLYQWADTYSMALVPQRPRYLCTTDNLDLAAFCAKYELACNKLVEQIHFEETLREIVLDSFFSFGLSKTGLVDAGTVEINEEWIDPGQPAVQRVSLDDWVMDMAVKSWSKHRYRGDKYAVPIEAVLSDPRMEKKVAKQLLPRKINTPNENDGQEMAEQISRGPIRDEADIVPMVELFDAYLPQDGIVATLAWDHRDLPPLAVMRWDGPDDGPYDYLAYSDVPDNVVPTSPGEHLYTLDDLYNGMMRKIRNQEQRRKTANIYNRRAARDAENLKNASDGEWVQVNNVEDIRAVAQGGADQVSVTMAQAFMQLFDRMGGNLQAMAGLGPQADTAAQDQLIHQSLSRKEQKMAYRVADFAARRGRALGWHLWNDQTTAYDLYQFTPNARVPVPSPWIPGEREGAFESYDISLDPYSLQYKTPQERGGRIVALLQNLFMPLMPMVAQQGVAFDFQRLVEMISKLEDEPRLRELFRFSSQPLPGMDQPGMGEQPGKPASTTRNYVRSQGGKGGENPIEALLTQMSSNGAQPQRIPSA